MTFDMVATGLCGFDAGGTRYSKIDEADVPVAVRARSHRWISAVVIPYGASGVVERIVVAGETSSLRKSNEIRAPHFFSLSVIEYYNRFRGCKRSVSIVVQIGIIPRR